MKKIAIHSAGEFYYVSVDDDDFPVLNRHKWYILHSGTNKRPYAFTRFYTEQDAKNGKTFLMHHLIMGTSGAVDHINGDSLNNCKDNLRVATYQENGWNKGKPNFKNKGPATSQFKGVRYTPLKGKPRWQAYFKHVEAGADKSTGKMIWLGYFDNEVDAAKAYNEAIVKYRGQYAWVNPIPGEQ
jgi:hypothetical protein